MFVLGQPGCTAARGGREERSFLSSFSLQPFGLIPPSPLLSRPLAVPRVAASREAPHTSLSDPLFLFLASIEESEALGIVWLFQVSLEKELNRRGEYRESPFLWLKQRSQLPPNPGQLPVHVVPQPLRCLFPLQSKPEGSPICCCSPERSKLLPHRQNRPLAPSPKSLVSTCALNTQSCPTGHQRNLLPWKQIMKTPIPAVGMGSSGWRRAQLCSLLLGAIGMSKGRVSCRAGEGEAHFYSPIFVTRSLN